jgi:biofilm PGA synthesis lipoprotein PgaB
MRNHATPPALNEAPKSPSSVSDIKHRLVSALVSVALVAFVTSYLVGPAAWQWAVASDRQEQLGDSADRVFEQFTTISAPPSDAELVAKLKAAPASEQGGPLILTYHDIGYNSSEYTITPEAFASQMQLLADAGWQTLSAGQLSAWLDGTPLPAHSVQITFDDGAHGIWQYADPILARNNQRAAAYVITGFVGTSTPYYVTWPELTIMQASGRWDLEAHTNLGHVEIATDAAGHKGPFLTNLKYLSEENRVETTEEFRIRVTGDLAESKKQLVAHGFPDPEFFAYPFSAHTEVPSASGVLGVAVRSLFKAAMLDQPHGVTATRSADLAVDNLDRMDMTSDVSLASYVQRISAVSPISPTNAQPLSMQSEWTNYREEPRELTGDSNGGVVLDPGQGLYTSRLFAPLRTALWTDYTVDATLGGFGQAWDGTSTGLTVLSKDPQQIDISVSANTYSVSQDGENGAGVLARGEIPAATSHRAEVTVAPGRVTVKIDGQQVSSTAVGRGGGTYGPAGGIQITGYRQTAASPVPRVLSISVR